MNVPRRGFLPQAFAMLVGAAALVIPLVAAIGFLLNPLRRKSNESNTNPDDPFLPLPIGPDALAADGTPTQQAVRTTIVDAWNAYPDQPIGKVWLRKQDDGSIVAFNTVCPHLGCDIDFRSAQDDFYCPCHASKFALDGERQNQIPPRDMDQLETKIVDGKIAVKFQHFRGGIAEKEPV